MEFCISEKFASLMIRRKARKGAKNEKMDGKSEAKDTSQWSMKFRRWIDTTAQSSLRALRPLRSRRLSKYSLHPWKASVNEILIRLTPHQKNSAVKKKEFSISLRTRFDAKLAKVQRTQSMWNVTTFSNTEMISDFSVLFAMYELIEPNESIFLNVRSFNIFNRIQYLLCLIPSSVNTVRRRTTSNFTFINCSINNSPGSSGVKDSSLKYMTPYFGFKFCLKINSPKSPSNVSNVRFS